VEESSMTLKTSPDGCSWRSGTPHFSKCILQGCPPIIPRKTLSRTAEFHNRQRHGYGGCNTPIENIVQISKHMLLNRLRQLTRFVGISGYPVRNIPIKTQEESVVL
jgi:hypothetical protein